MKDGMERVVQTSALVLMVAVVIISLANVTVLQDGRLINLICTKFNGLAAMSLL